METAKLNLTTARLKAKELWGPLAFAKILRMSKAYSVGAWKPFGNRMMAVTYGYSRLSWEDAFERAVVRES